MIHIARLPLLVPFPAARAGRRPGSHLPPRRAVRLLTATARPIGRAALAPRASSAAGRTRPGPALPATAGPVPRRGAALLGHGTEAGTTRP
ncbi:hypothetical protein [Streptomyces sp. NBC_01276]|uniref:hypothetical protein n=1 Tax=Streptomyces sp. NBC_01276 TaxID=2903808 RepID=UPI002F91AA25